MILFIFGCIGSGLKTHVMETVFSGSFSEAAIVRNLLESRGFVVFASNEGMSQIEPVAVSGGGFHPVKLSVGRDDFARAMALVEKYHSGDLDLSGTAPQ